MAQALLRLFGPFLLVFVAAGGGLLHAQGQISLAAAVVAPGLMVMAIILLATSLSQGYGRRRSAECR